MTASLSRILLATDLSARSDRALARATQLADQTGCALSIVHVVDEEAPDRVRDAATRQAQAEIGASLARIAPALDERCVIEIVAGSGARSILEVVERSNVDLLVLGLHRNETAASALIGSTIERSLRLGSAPVLVVKSAADGPYRKVLAATDFSAPARRALEVAHLVAPEAAITLSHAYQTPFPGLLGEDTRRDVAARHRAELEETADALRAALNPSAAALVTMDIEEGDPIAVLSDAADRLKPNLLALGALGRLGPASALLGGVARHFLRHPPCDILAVRGL